MTIDDLFKDKTTKAKEKVTILGQWLSDKKITSDELISYSLTAKDPVKASCIEAFEYATKENPAIANEKVLAFATEHLTHKAPRIKWESAKVIGNIAHRFPDKLETAIGHLLENTEHEGTVLRWSAAFSLGEILKLKTPLNKDLLPTLIAISERDDKNSIRKIYLDAIKKVTK